MAYTANCTLVGQTYNNSAWGSYNPGQACWAGNDQGDSYTTIIKFTTPSFSGRSTRLTVSFPTKHISGYYNSQWPDIRYALCSSDANKAAYRNTTSAVSDPYQIASGYKEITAGDPVTLTFDTSVLKANTSYYVYIWGGDSYSKFQIDIYPSATLTYVKTFTVTYNANGVGDAPAAVTVDEGSSIALPEMSAERYEFLGWATSADAASGMTGTYKPTASITLYAVWELKCFDLILDPKSGRFADGSREARVLSGMLIFSGTDLNSLTDYAARKNGCSFLGWFDAGGTKVYDRSGNAVRGTTYWDADGKYIYPGNLSLYAHWNIGILLRALFHLATKGKIQADVWAVRSGNTLVIYRAHSATQNGNTLEVR